MSDHDDDCGDHFEKLNQDIEKFGWHIVLVREDDEGPGFGYTVGVHKTLGQPEIIMIGLPRLEAMGAILNGVATDMKGGRRFEVDKPSGGVIEGFDCVFRPVHVSHYDGYLGQAMRFYKGTGFPVLQCVWPDKKGRYPWDKDAAQGLAGQQPVLDAPWPFKEPRSTAVFTTRQVLEQGRPIAIVSHDVEDGAWQFLCDTEERGDSDARVVDLGCMIGLDPSVGQLADLPLGWWAWREGGVWKRDVSKE